MFHDWRLEWRVNEKVKMDVGVLFTHSLKNKQVSRQYSWIPKDVDLSDNRMGRV